MYFQKKRKDEKFGNLCRSPFALYFTVFLRFSGFLYKHGGGRRFFLPRGVIKNIPLLYTFACPYLVSAFKGKKGKRMEYKTG
jgi:hypothetical protein